MRSVCDIAAVCTRPEREYLRDGLFLGLPRAYACLRGVETLCVLKWAGEEGGFQPTRTSLDENGAVVSILGRKLRFDNVWGELVEV